ncbi:MAG: hypothetical protein Q8N47_25985 [Bryobacterales bacterium]|nr:hypothetical protein [Bryobacterales bacterium]
MAIAGGGGYSLALKSDGTVWAWGDNTFGELGDGSTMNRLTPVPVSGLTGVVAIAAANHSLALKSDGTVWAWGYNDRGQLGDRTTTDRSTPVPVSGLTGVVGIAAAYSNSLALKSDGTVAAWGYNGYGSLGDDSNTNRLTPVPVSGLTGVAAIAGGDNYGLALKSDGTAWAWGANYYGQLGDGTTTQRLTPVLVIGLTTPTESISTPSTPSGPASGTTGVSYSYSTSGASSSLGHSVQYSFDWGDGTNSGWLGAGVTSASHSWASAGSYSVRAMARCVTDTAVQSSWSGGLTVTVSAPETVSAPTTPSGTASGTMGVSYSYSTGAASSSLGHSVQYYLDWGDGTNSGWLGAGVTSASHSWASASSYTVKAMARCVTDTSVQSVWSGGLTVVVSGVAAGGFAAIAAGGAHSLAVWSDGTVRAWGLNDSGQLGDGSTANRLTQVPVSGLTGVLAVAGGANHSLALKSDGTVWAWGNNAYGQLGDGGSTNRLTPVLVSGLTGVVAIAGGTYHSLALRADGTVWVWGIGWLVDGNTTNRLTPVQVSGLTGVVAIAAGFSHGVALKSDGTVWAWGYNNNGQLGDGSTTNQATPVPVSGLTGVVAIAAGDYCSLAVKNGGAVRAWGNNYYGQLGDGTTTTRLTPVPVSGLSGVLAIAGGYNHSLAVKSGGTVWAWGSSGGGQLLTPVQVGGLTGVVAIAGGGGHSLALKSDGTVWAWGTNSFGQLGDGSTTDRWTPAQINGLSVTISGQVTRGGVALAGVTVTLTGGAGGTRTTDASGNYSFTGVVAGVNYTVTPSLANHSFTPPSAVFNNIQVNQTGNFIAQLVNGPPIVTSVIPGAGVSATQTFTFNFSDPNGWQDVGVVNVLINFWLDGSNSCYLAYSRPGNTLYLLNNAGDGYAGSMLLNGSGTLGNSQCIISGTGSEATGSGNTMTLTLNMTFPASFAGTRIIYTAARDSIENNSGWQRMGVWKVPGGSQTTTTAVAGMNPARGTGAGGTFAFTFTDTRGASDLGVMNILVNDWLDGRHACYLAYARGNNTLYLMNDNGDALLPGKVLNGSGSLGNSQCTVNAVGSSATPSGNTLTLTLNITFGAGFAGNRVFYLAARDVNELNNTGWQAMGSWTVQ